MHAFPMKALHSMSSFFTSHMLSATWLWTTILPGCIALEVPCWVPSLHRKLVLPVVSKQEEHVAFNSLRLRKIFLPSFLLPFLTRLQLKLYFVKCQASWLFYTLSTLTTAALLVDSPFLFFNNPNRWRQELPEKLQLQLPREQFRKAPDVWWTYGSEFCTSVLKTCLCHTLGFLKPHYVGF